MRIGLTGGGDHRGSHRPAGREAEADGFTSLWYASAVFGDPLVAMALAGRATKTIELGTSVLQTYTSHPVLQANRGASIAAAWVALGSPWDRPVAPAGDRGRVRPLLRRLPAAHRGVRTVLAALLRGEGVDFDGKDFRVHIPRREHVAPPVSLLIAALGPPVAPGGRRAGRRHDPLDGQGQGDRDARRAPHPGRGRGRGATGAADRRRAAGGGARRRATRPARTAAAVRAATACCRTTGGCSTSGGRRTGRRRHRGRRGHGDREHRGAVRRGRDRCVGRAVRRR